MAKAKGRLATAIARERAISKLKQQEKKISKKKEHDLENQKKKNVQVFRARQYMPVEWDDRLLLVGEGDFSFSASLLQNGVVRRVVATCLDSEDKVLEKYPDTARLNIDFVKEFSAEGQSAQEDNTIDDKNEILFEIDATRLNSSKSIRKLCSKGNLFTNIVFNFPHLGSGMKDQTRNVIQHQKLISDFFASANDVLASNGRIVISLFEGAPYTLWNVKGLAKNFGFALQRSARINWDSFPGYHHCRTSGKGTTTKEWKDRGAKFFIFVRAKELEAAELIKEKKKKEREDDADDW